MKLFYSAGSCSTSCHISLVESGLKFEAIEVDWDNASDPNLAEVMRLNPLGTLPIAIIENGRTLTQNLSIHTFIADKAPQSHLLPAPGTIERAEAMNWLSFVASDLHKAFGPLFAVESIATDPKGQADIRAWATKNVHGYLSFLDKHLEGKDYLTGKQFTVADAYCFVVVGWTKWLKIPTDSYRNLSAYLARVAQRPAVQKVLKEEGLLDQAS